MKKQTIARGFTLIELLVVIAIIGILSAVVLAALNTARAKGSDAQIKSNLKTIAAQAALDYDSQATNEYVASNFTAGTSQGAWPAGAGGETPASTGTGAAGTSGVYLFNATAANQDRTVSAAMAQASTANNGHLQWAATASTFAVEAKLTASGATNWCIDSTGKTEQTGTLLANSASALCP